MDVVELPPCAVRFAQNKISDCFSNGYKVNQEVIHFQQASKIRFPLPRIIRLRGAYYCLDNRRLYVYKALHAENCFSLMRAVKVRWNDLTPKEKKRCRNFQRFICKSVRFYSCKDEIMDHSSFQCQQENDSRLA